MEAKLAAKGGDGGGLHAALARLKPVAKMVIDVGEKIAAGLALVAIKSASGV